MSIQDPPYLRLLPPIHLAERSDVELVYALREDQAWARRELWDRYSGDVRRYLARALGRPGVEVEDLTQEVFLTLFSHRASVGRAELLRYFTREVAVRVLDSNLRKRRWTGRQITLFHGGDADTLEVAVESEPHINATLRDCRLVLDTLDAQERAAFTLHFTERLTFDEVAEAMTVSSFVARRLIYRATRIIADQLRRRSTLASPLSRQQHVRQGTKADRRRTGSAATDQEPSDLETYLAEALARGIVSTTRISVSSSFDELSFALVERRLARRRRRARPLRMLLMVAGAVASGAIAYGLQYYRAERAEAAMTYQVAGGESLKGASDLRAADLLASTYVTSSDGGAAHSEARARMMRLEVDGQRGASRSTVGVGAPSPSRARSRRLRRAGRPH